MDLSDRMRRWAGWLFLAVVATLSSMGYHFGNIRFAPVAAGFAILAGVCLHDRWRAPVRSNGVHPGTTSGIHRASG